eukprot:TRINITY_DN1278_c0_g1_i5.p1 TRINITY_DN1278_c0_g1~~TRINITY_DN1278_c0_g1_i5.p1  ORF type:complete len:103 (+),score=5.76 TRINITY_DN1278_c0_g1_i5:234-542(+)
MVIKASHMNEFSAFRTTLLRFPLHNAITGRTVLLRNQWRVRFRLTVSARAFRTKDIAGIFLLEKPLYCFVAEAPRLRDVTVFQRKYSLSFFVACIPVSNTKM